MSEKDLFSEEDFLYEIDRGKPSGVIQQAVTIESPVEIKDSEQVMESVENAETENCEEDLLYTNEIPKLLPIPYPDGFMEIYRRISKHYAALPRLKYSDVYKELSKLTVRSSPTPSLQVISSELERSQGAKERVSELEMEISQCYIFKERAVSILQESWYKFCDEKSADKRKGDAQYRLASFELDLAKTESISKACIGIMKNLDSLQNVLSRKITNIQLQIKLMDIGRTSLPDYEFGRKYDGGMKIDEVIGVDPSSDTVINVDPESPINAKELDF